VLRLRFRQPQRVLAEFLGVVTGTIAAAEQQILPLLDQCVYAIKPAGTRLKTPTDLTAYAQAHGLVPHPESQNSALISCRS